MTTLNANLIFRAGGSPITAIKEQGSVLYASMQEGLIYRVGVQLFLNIRNNVLYSGEMGLLGLAFHPNNNLRFFLWYSEEPNNPPSGFNHVNRLEEWNIVGGVPQRKGTILRIPHPTTVHNGNNNIFYDITTARLMLATGDGGNSALAQQDDSLFGKILSIDIDNSFWQTNENNTPVTLFSQLTFPLNSLISIVAKGLRNPSRFDQKNGIKSISVAGQSNREFAFAFRNYSKNFGWRAFEGVIPTVSGTTVLYPTEVNQLLHQNVFWRAIASYANASSTGLTPEVFRGNAMSGIDYYQGSIGGLINHLIFTDLGGQVFHAFVPQSPFEIVLQIPQRVDKINVNNMTGFISTMYITNSGRILIAHNTNSNGMIITNISELTQ